MAAAMPSGARGQAPAEGFAPSPAAAAAQAASSSAPSAEAAASAADLAALRDQLAAQQKQLDEQRGTVEALQAQADAAAEALGGDAIEEPTFRVYGFIDMGLQKLWSNTDDPSTPTRKSTFVLGNINLYFDFRPTQSWSSLVEVRFTAYPRGKESPGIPALGRPYERLDTSIYDPGIGPGSDTVDWGSIILERAYIQWHKLDWLGLRVGQFFTPYGIWNVDHGTPTLIGMYRPKSVVNQIWPATQLGVEAFGALPGILPTPWLLEWHATVSNGRTPGTVDPTEPKMIGGRIKASTTRPYRMTFGASAMTGEYSEQEHNIDIITGETSRPVLIAYAEQGAALDASLDIGSLRLRSELTLRHLDYEAGKHEPAWFPGVYQASRVEWDVYAIAAYRVPGTRFEPYGYAELYRWPTILGDAQITGSGGLNTYFTPSIQLKVQVAHQRWVNLEDLGPGRTPYRSHFAVAKLVMGL